MAIWWRGPPSVRVPAPMILEITSGADAGRTANIRGDKFTLGREGTTNLVLRDAKASRQHASLRELPDGRVELTDLGSRNGTFVNGQQLTGSVTLGGGEEIRIGDTTMRLVPEQAPQETTAALPPTPGAPPPPPGAPPPPPGGAGPAGPPPGQPPPPIAPPFQDRAPQPPQPVQPAAQAPGARPIVRQPDAPPAPGPSASTMQRLVIQRGLKRVTIIGIAVLVLLVVVIGGLVTGVFGGGDDELSNAEVVDQSRPRTVLVVTSTLGGGGRGSGWVWDASRGLIVTNAHVTAGGESYSVSTGDKLTIEVGDGAEIGGEDAREAEVKGEALCEDISVLEVKDKEGLESMPRVPNKEALEVGDDVVVVGYPSTINLTQGQSQQDADLTGNTGVISTVSTTFPAIEGESFSDPTVGPYKDAILTDAVINQGNSGGPLVNREAKLVGMNSAQRTDVQGQFYAVGIDRINEIVPKLIEGEDVC